MSAQISISNQVVLDLYLKQLESEDLTTATLRLRREQLKVFQAWLGPREPSAITARLFLAELKDRGYLRNTLRSYYYAVKTYLAYLEVPFKVRFKREKRLPRYHSHEDISRVLEAINRREDNWSRLKERDRLIFRTLMLSGLRRAELLNLKCHDVREGYLFVYRGNPCICKKRYFL